MIDIGGAAASEVIGLGEQRGCLVPWGRHGCPTVLAEASIAPPNPVRRLALTEHRAPGLVDDVQAHRPRPARIDVNRCGAVGPNFRRRCRDSGRGARLRCGNLRLVNVRVVAPVHESDGRRLVGIGFRQLDVYPPESPLIRACIDSNGRALVEPRRPKRRPARVMKSKTMLRATAVIRGQGHKRHLDLLSLGPAKSTLNSLMLSSTSSTFQSDIILHNVRRRRARRAVS